MVGGEGISGSLRYAASALLGLCSGSWAHVQSQIAVGLRGPLVDLQAKHRAIFTDFSIRLVVVWGNHRRVCHIQV